jgi:hypothetical protein
VTTGKSNIRRPSYDKTRYFSALHQDYGNLVDALTRKLPGPSPLFKLANHKGKIGWTSFSSVIRVNSVRTGKRRKPSRKDLPTAKVMRAFAATRHFNSLDRRELFIRWGEAFVEKMVYPRRPKERDKWLEKEDLAAIRPALTHRGRTLDAFVRHWSWLHDERVDLRLNSLAVRLELTSGGFRAALKNGTLTVKQFKKLVRLLGVTPSQQAYLHQLYVESLVREPLVSMDSAVFVSELDPALHERTLEWLLGFCPKALI